MKAAAALIVEGLRHERGEEAVARRDRTHHRFKRDEIIRAFDGVAQAAIDLILSRPLFMMTTLRAVAKLFERQTYFAPKILTLIERRDIEITGAVVGLRRIFALFVKLEQIKFAF